VRFWAGARHAAGRAEEPTQAATIGELRRVLGARPELSKVVSVASFLIDGVRADDAATIPTRCVIDVLPPFAGG
jgi:molybdopterin synthase sulfur carrier subunit